MSTESHCLDVREGGAVGDGTTKDTQRIQQAIDRVAAAGGGTVLFPPGVYLSGTIQLRSNVELHLMAGATLLASPDRADYNDDQIVDADVAVPAEKVSAAHLLIALDVENVSITGRGTIDGNADAFMGATRLGTDPSVYRTKGEGNRAIGDWRPGQMLFFHRSSRIAVRDVLLQNAPYWTVYFFWCQDVVASGLSIINPPDTQNGDGIDIVSCSGVRVSDCLIRTGDDCIVARTRNRRLPEDPPCEDVVVTNCVLSSPTAGIRIGVANGLVRNCTFSNLVITHARTGILIVSRYSTTPTNVGATIERIRFSDLVMDVAVPFSIVSGIDAMRPGAIRDVAISRASIRASAAAQVIGTAAVPVEYLRLTDLDWVVAGGTDNKEFWDALPEPLTRPGHGGHPGFDGAPGLPSALFFRQATNPVLDGVRLRWEQPGAVWRDAIDLADCSDVVTTDVDLPMPSAGS